MREFFDTLFAGKPDSHVILIWEKNGELKKSSWFTDVNKAIEYAEKNSDHDLYVGCGTATEAFLKTIPSNLRSSRRCPANKIAGIPAFWIDIDLAGPGHKKTQLPETEEEAKKILDCIPFKPTIEINSGHGRQYWWVFTEYWTFDNDKERETAAVMAQRFTVTLREKARSLGYDLDMTFDLSRIFRIPGCMNTKTSPPVQSSIILCNGSRYAAYDFDDFITVIPERKVSKKDTVMGQKFNMNPAAEPPFSKFEALMEAEPKFKKSWELKRKDFKDDSPSSYDYSLASFAFMAKWTWQEVVDLLIAFRRKHGFDLKLRYDYYERTLTKCESTVVKDQAQEGIDDIILNISKEEATRPAILEYLSQLLGVPITNIIKYIMDPPEYKLVTPRGNITLGGVQHLVEQRGLRLKIAAATGHYMGIFKPEKWNMIAQALLNACEEENVGEEGTNEGQVRAWIIQYLQEKRIFYDADEAQTGNNPFVKRRYLFIFLGDLREYLSMYRRELQTAKAMSKLMKEFGFQPEIMTFKRVDNTVVTRSTFKIDIEHEDVKGFIDFNHLTI